MVLAERLSRTRALATSQVKLNTLIVVATILIAMLFQFFLLTINIPAEAALSLQCGLLIADGKVPFVDFFEVCSPALMYVNAIPACLSKIIPVAHPILLFHICLTILIAASCYLSASLLFRQRLREQAHVPMLVLGFALLNLLMINEAGQRESLFLLFYFPFFVCRWLTWTNQRCEKRLALSAGISGGIAACLDPLCLLAVIAMEIFFLIAKLKISPFRSEETKAALVVVALFFCHFAFFPSAYANSYFNWALQMVLCDYKLYDERLYWPNTTPDLRKLVYVVIFTITFALGLRRWCSLIAPCIALSIIGFGMFIIQGKTMTYQTLPMIFGAGMAAFLVVSVLYNALTKWKGLTLTLFKTTVVAAVSVLFLAAFIIFKLNSVKNLQTFDLNKIGYFGSVYVTDPSVAATMLLRETEVNDSVLILNDRVRPAYPLLVQYRRKPAGYLLTGFPLRMSRLLIDSNLAIAANFTGAQFQMYQRLIADIQAKPKLIILERDSLGGVLTDHEVLKTIDSLYEEIGYADWPDTAVEQSFDYYGYRIAMPVYKLRPTAAAPASPATPVATPVNPTVPVAAPIAPATPVVAPVDPNVPVPPVVAPVDPNIPVPAPVATPVDPNVPVPAPVAVPVNPNAPVVAPATPAPPAAAPVDPNVSVEKRL